MHAQVRRAIERIALYPLGAPALTQRPSIRRVPLVRYPYLIYYEVGGEAVTILRISHGAASAVRG